MNAKCNWHRILQESYECPNPMILKKKNSSFNNKFSISNGEINIPVLSSASNKELQLTIDTGANISILKPEKLDKEILLKTNENTIITGISNDSKLFSMGSTLTNICMNNVVFPHIFHVVHKNVNLKTDGILGNDFLIKFGAVIDFKSNIISFVIPELCKDDVVLKQNKKIRKIKSKKSDPNYYNELKSDFTQFEKLKLKLIQLNKNISYTQKRIGNQIINVNTTAKINERINIIMQSLKLSHLDDSKITKMREICSKFNGAFYIEGDVLKHTDVVQHKIELKPGTTPIATRQYRIPESQKDEIQRQIDEMETRGIIEQSNSAWNSPLLLVPKKENEEGQKQYRLVIDYRKLNAATLPVSYPIPLIDEIIDQMSGSNLFTTLDLQGAFHQIPMHPASKELTAFSTSWNKYHFNSSPFGLVGSPYTWLRAIHTVLKGIIGKGIYVYMDDIIIHSKGENEHFKLLTEVLKRLEENNLKLKIEKSSFFKNEVSYLGHIISENGIKADPKKTECMTNFPKPNNITEMQRFLGMCNYYRRYVKNYAKIAKPLYILCKKDIPFIWNEACESAFTHLKKALSSPPILLFPNFQETFIVTTDASDYAVGAVISQGNIPYDKPIQFFSKTLGETQSRYSTIEKELLAIVWAVEFFRHYLYGREFLILTDHKPLTFLFNSKNINNRLHRWKLTLMQYQFKIVHKEGAQNVVADALSRIKINFTKNGEKKILIQTRQQSKNVENVRQNSPESYYIEENNGFLLNKSQYDHIFYIYENENSIIWKKLQHKLKRKLVLPSDHRESELYRMDDDKTILKCPLDLSNINEIEKRFIKIIEFCNSNQFINIAINLHFTNAPNYFKFKQVIQRKFSVTKIKITIFLNKIIEITNTDDIQEILQLYHKTLLGGHTGLERMKNTIRKFYYWPSMTHDIKTFIKNCSICETTKIQKHTKMPIEISSTASRPFQKIFLDLVGPISPLGSEGNNYIFTCNCDLTKYAIATPIKDCSALTTAKALIHSVILKYGFPDEIVTDNGTNFISDTLKEVTKILKIKKTLTSPYHPQSNQIERYHRTLSTYLKIFVKNDPIYWDIYLDFATFSYNISQNSTTGFSPFELLFGYEIKLPSSITQNPIPNYNYENYAQEIRKKLQHAHIMAKEKILQRKKSNKMTHDKNVNQLDLKRNDLVLVLKHKKNHKFDIPYEGPYRVEAITSPVTIKIRKGKKSYRIHVNRVKLATANYGPDTPPLLPNE